MTPCGVSHALFGLVFAYVFSEIALSCCVFAASAVVRGLGSCVPSLRLVARLCCRLSFGGVAMFHVKHFEACEKRTENVSRETFVCRNMSSEGASSAASLVALVRCRERSVLRVSRGPCLVRDAPGCPGMGVKRAAWARAVEDGVTDRRARRSRRTRRAQGVPLCAARSVRRRRCGADGSRFSAGSLWGQRRLRGRSGGSVDRGAALRGQRRLLGSLCVDNVACWGRSGGAASLRGVAFAEDGVARGAALRGRRRSGCRRATRCRRGRRRDGPIASGSRLPEGFARFGVRRASRVESTPGGTHDSAPLPSWGGYRAVRRSVRGYCARPGSRAYRIGFGTPRRGITCGFDIRGRRVRVQRRQRLRQVAAARPEALHRLERCVLGGVSC